MKITAKRQDNNPDPEEQLDDNDAAALLDIIMKDPDTEIGTPDSDGDQLILYKGTIIGILNPSKGYGAIDPDAYQMLSGELEIEKDPEVSDAIMSGDKIAIGDKADSEDSLKQQIVDALDEEMCIDIVNQAFSEYGEFSDEVFTYAGGKDDSFFESLDDDTPRNVAFMFFEGKDLDDGGPANPGRDYFRFDKKGNIESTDNPGAIYMDTIIDDIADHIIANMENDVEFPEEIEKLITKYLEDKEG